MIRTRTPLPILLALLTAAIATGPAESRADPPAKAAVDVHGDALPPGAVARFGTLRWRHNITVNEIALHPDGSLIASVRNGGGIQLWDAKTGRESERFRGKPIRGEQLAFSPDGKTLLTGDREGRIQRWEVSSGKLLHEGPGKYKECPLFAVEQDDRTVLVLSGSGKTVLLDNKTADQLLQLRKDKSVHGIDISPDGKLMAAATARGPVCLYDARTGEVRRKWQGHKDGAFQVKFSPDGNRLVGWSWRSDIRVWDVSSGKELLQLPLPGDGHVYTFSPDGGILVVSGQH
jgi:WD40 repeat protein